MKTDDLLALLAADTPQRPSVQVRAAQALPAALVLSLSAFALIWGARADLGAALASAALWKTIAPAALAVLALPLAIALSRPDSNPATQRRVLWVFGFAAFAAFAVALWSGGFGTMINALAVPSLIVCLVSIQVLALPILGALLWALSSGAALNPGQSGLVAGLAASGIATTIYSLYCNQDALLFYLPAYSAAILAVALIGRSAGERFLVW